MKNMNRFKRNIGLEYLFCFVRAFNISSAIWVLYMVYKGLSLWEIGIVEGVYHLASFLFEVPTGAFADLLGRKTVMILGRICSAISCIILLYAGNILGFLFGFVLSAFSDNLNSGSEEALVYDSMKEIGTEEGYIKVNGRLNVIIEVSQGMATFVGGILAEYSYFVCYMMSAVIAIGSLIPLSFMKEPPIGSKEKKKEKVTVKTHFKTSFHLIKENPKVIKILIYYPVVAAFYTVLFFYGQQYFAEYGFDKVGISLIMLGASAVSCVGSLCSEWALARFGEKTKYIASVIMAIGIILVSRNQVVISMIGFAAASFVNSLLYPIESSSLNQLIPSEQRATIISVDSMCFSFAMICIFPLSGVIATVLSLRIAFLVLGIVEIAMVALLIRRKHS